MKKILPVLMTCSLFAGIEETQLAGLLGCLGAKTAQYAKGDSVLREGDPAGWIGVVVSGRVQVAREDYDGNRSMLAKLGAGELFAEVFACAGMATMPVSVMAAEATQVMLIDAKRISHACAEACEFHRRMVDNLMQILARKNLMFSEKIEVTSRRSTRGKLMAYLLIQAKKNGSSAFSIPFDRQELADYLEVDRSGLSAEISKLRREGVLVCEKNRFTLLDLKG